MRGKHGLKVVQLTPEAEREWRREVARMYPQIRGAIVPAPMFDAVAVALGERPENGP
jgi:hypothetical protein